MNQQPQNQERKPQENAPVGGAKPNMQRRAPQSAASRPVAHKHVQKNEKKLRVLQLVMCIVVVMILIVGILLLTLPMFRVKTIVVEGNSFYSAEEIIAASGIKEGDEIWSVISGHRSREIDNRIYSTCGYIRSIKISCGLSKVTITVTEVENLMYAEENGGWYAFDTNLHVWEENAEESAFSPFLKVKLPAVLSAQKGQGILFASTEITYGYIGELIDLLDASDVLEHVTYIDFSNKFSVSCVIEDTVRMELGSVSAIERKLECFHAILAEKNSADYAVIDVSDPTKATYRKISYEELYQ